jgi:carboxylesterase
VTIAVERVVPGDAELGVLLIHGLTGSAAEMSPVAEALAGRYPLWVARVAGHDTTVAELARTSWHDWYRSAERGVDALTRVASRVAVVGLSMGAMLAIRLATAHRADVAGVGLLSPAVALRRPWARRLRVPLRMLAAADARLPPLQRLLARSVATKGNSDIADLAVRSAHPGYRQVPLRALLNLLVLQRLAWHTAPALMQPALVIHAIQDHTCPIEAARLLFARLGSSEKRMVELAECFHVVTVDCERAHVIAELERFLGELAVRSSSTGKPHVG